MRDRKYELGQRDEFMPLVEAKSASKGQLLVQEEKLLFTPKVDGNLEAVQTLAEKVTGGWRPFFVTANLKDQEHVKSPSDGYLSNIVRGVLAFPSEKHRQGTGVETLNRFLVNLEEYAEVSPDEIDRVKHIVNEISSGIRK